MGNDSVPVGYMGETAFSFSYVSKLFTWSGGETYGFQNEK